MNKPLLAAGAAALLGAGALAQNVNHASRDWTYHLVIKQEPVRDHHIPAGCRRALDHVECRHDRRGDTCHGRLGVTGLERVRGPTPPGNAQVLFDAIDDLAGGQSAGLPESGSGGADQRGTTAANSRREGVHF